MTTIACIKTAKNIVIGCDRQNTLMGSQVTGCKFNGMYRKIFNMGGNKRIVMGGAGRMQGLVAFKNDKKLAKVFSDIADEIYTLHEANQYTYEEIGEFLYDSIHQKVLPVYKKAIERWEELQADAETRTEIEDDGVGNKQIVKVTEIISSIKVLGAIGNHIFSINELFDICVYNERTLSIGSGSEYAIGAMSALNDNTKLKPEEIVRFSIIAASKFDPYTGNEIVVMETEPYK